MRVTLKVLSLDHTRLPGLDEDGEGTVTLDDGTTIAQLADMLNIDDPDPYVVLVNDRPTTGGDRDAPLADGDTMIVFPPIKGG